MHALGVVRSNPHEFITDFVRLKANDVSQLAIEMGLGGKPEYRMEKLRERPFSSF
jgi:hypothetical protein